MDIYLEAITPENHDCKDFDPKVKQKAVYRWYDSRYSDEAWDIYSKDWETRILQWHAACRGPWNEARQIALRETNTALNTDEQLERLPFGKFFLAHPIAAFSLWRVLQSCYGLDRAVCGATDEVAAWQQLAPFQYLRNSEVEHKWQIELELLRKQVTGRRLNFKKQTWETKLYDIHQGIEIFEKEFAAMRENFGVNLMDMKFASWMIYRIDEDVGKRIAMITDLLRFKDSELANIQPTESHDDDINDVDTFPAPGYCRTATFPPSYSSPVTPVKPKFPHRTVPTINTITHAAGPQPLEKPVNKGGVVSSIKKGFQKIKRKVRKSKKSPKPKSHR